jgi:riboflavin kinase/FMN adenylyltransferase
MVVTHGWLPGRERGAWAVTIGNFDGVHRGHRALLDRVIATGRERDIGSCVLTFEPHPREFFSPKTAPARLTRLRDKLELMSQAGIGRVHVARFDRRLASLSAAAFADEVLTRGLGARSVLVGRDFRYGSQRAGNFDSLQADGRRLGFAVESMADVQVEGERVSSSAVRAALAAGDFGRAERLLGRRYSISGRVAHGPKLGRELGWPTANIALRRAPALSGIYVVEAEIEEEGARLQGVASLGLRPTVNPTPRPLLEVHLFDFGKDIYGKHLRVAFLEKVRDEKKFDNLDQLKRAIAEDARRAREYFEQHG